MAVMASCAFLSLAAETIFMALVICMVEDTDAILLRISLRFAIMRIVSPNQQLQHLKCPPPHR